MSEPFSAAGSFVHTPFGPRKSGMPDSVEMPAPVSTTTCCASRSQPAISVSCSIARQGNACQNAGETTIRGKRGVAHHDAVDDGGCRARALGDGVQFEWLEWFE